VSVEQNVIRYQGQVMKISAIVNGVRPGTPGWDSPWVVKPRLGDRFSTDREEALSVLYHELAVVARVHSIAVLMRGRQDAWTSDMPRFRQVAESSALPSGLTAPTWELFLDTGSWHHAAADGLFDCGNPDHRRRAWVNIFRPWFDIFASGRLERLEDGRIPIMLWSIAPGVLFTRQAAAADMLEAFGLLLEQEYGLAPAWHVDQSFLQHAPGGAYWAANSWFDPKVSGHTIRRYDNGVTIGVVVPGFHDPQHVPANERRVLDRRNGATLREGLEACRAANCERVYIEGWTGWEEQTLCMETHDWGRRELLTVRQFTTTFTGEDGMLIGNGTKIVLRSRANGRLVCADNAGEFGATSDRRVLVARTPSGEPGEWEELEALVVRDGYQLPEDDGGEPPPEITPEVLKRAGFFGYQDKPAYAAPGDFEALERIFAFAADEGYQAKYSNDRDWVWQIDRMLQRTA
jgi:hypothetical protein